MHCSTPDPNPPTHPPSMSHQVNSACCEDNADALSHHEVLLPGHLLMKFLKEKLEDCMLSFKEAVKKDLEKSPAGVDLMVGGITSDQAGLFIG